MKSTSSPRKIVLVQIQQLHLGINNIMNINASKFDEQPDVFKMVTLYQK